MGRNIKLTLAYDGTDFHGWQRQPGMRTVQEEVEKAARPVCRHPLSVRGASRTDAGVHARGQVASFVDESGIPPHKLALAIGHRLPPDVALLSAVEVPPEFDASLSAVGKHYRYRIHNDLTRPVAQLRQRYAWHVWYPLDLAAMRAAAAKLLGTHDFAGFATAGSSRKTTVRTVFSIEIERRVDLPFGDDAVGRGGGDAVDLRRSGHRPDTLAGDALGEMHDAHPTVGGGAAAPPTDAARRLGGQVILDFRGGGFLYNQVRNMVGTLFEIGRGHWPVERIDEILRTCDRRRAGPTAPAHGLCLERIWYESEREAQASGVECEKARPAEPRP